MPHTITALPGTPAGRNGDPTRLHADRGSAVRQIRTPRGWRLLQHGTVLSEMIREPGPTHSVFDVLAAAVRLHPAPRKVALLGFGGGGTVAALRGLGVQATIHGVDLDDRGHELLRKERVSWLRATRFVQADAVSWLSRSRHRFDVIVEDLSVPIEGSVEKPPASWDELPHLIHRRLAPGGIAILNLLPPRTGGWNPGLARALAPFARSALVHFDSFHNRIALAGGLPDGSTPRSLGLELRRLLTTLGSSQADAIRLGRAPNPSAKRAGGRRLPPLR